LLLSTLSLHDALPIFFVDRHSKQSGLTTSADLRGVPLKRYRDTPHYLSALSILREAEPNGDALNGNSILSGLEEYRSLLDGRSRSEEHTSELQSRENL